MRQAHGGRASVRHDDGTRTGTTHFQTKMLPQDATEMANSMPAYNLYRAS